MSDKLCKRAISGNKEQEIIMQDVLGGLEEIATLLSYDPWPGDFEIIAVYAPEEEDDLACRQQETVVVKAPAARRRAEVIPLKEHLRKSA